MPLVRQRLTVLVRDRSFSGLLAASVALGLALSFVVPFLSTWGTRRVGFSPVQFSGFMTAVTVSAIALSTVLGRWSDTRAVRRTLLLCGSACGVLGYAGYALLSSRWALTLVGVSFVATASICFSQLFAHVGESFT
ncbi:MAG TPA: MFS transporter, partial [Opitutus sp.]|nr:MFS transporter [Opitutus sp.]